MPKKNKELTKNNDLKLDICKNIQNNISNLSQNELYEIFKILHNNNSNYTKNNNGIFINLNWLDNNILDQINNYIIFCIKSHKEIKKHEIIKNIYNDNLNKNKNKNEINNNLFIENNEDNNIDNDLFINNNDDNINKNIKISSSMKFYLFKKKFMKKNIISNNNIYNILIHEKYLL
jgi:hypothetical protein|tara:strand:- start:458 stop:985 length:528 start_codon:yes stop_codon:yes gene_type:complete